MRGIFLDSETTGLNYFKHRIIEIAFQIVDMMTGEVEHTLQSVVSATSSDWKLSDPESLKINGFTWGEVQAAPSAHSVAQQIEAIFNQYELKRKQAIFICQNPSFDRAFFSQIIDPMKQEKLLFPYHWLDLASMYWTDSLKNRVDKKGGLPWETGCSKDQIAAVYDIAPEEKPHRALNGVKHLLACYEAVIGFPQKKS